MGKNDYNDISQLKNGDRAVAISQFEVKIINLEHNLRILEVEIEKQKQDCMNRDKNLAEDYKLIKSELMDLYEKKTCLQKEIRLESQHVQEQNFNEIKEIRKEITEQRNIFQDLLEKYNKRDMFYEKMFNAIVKGYEAEDAIIHNDLEELSESLDDKFFAFERKVLVFIGSLITIVIGIISYLLTLL